MAASWKQSRDFDSRSPRCSMQDCTSHAAVLFKRIPLCAEHCHRAVMFMKTLGLQPGTFDGDFQQLLALSW